MPNYEQPRTIFLHFTVHLPQDKLLVFANKQMGKTQKLLAYYSFRKKLKIFHKIFLEKVHIRCFQKCSPPAKARAFRRYCESLQQVIPLSL